MKYALPETEVIRIYEVYIDIYFIENGMMDAQLLILTMLLLKEKILPRRLAAASLTGGIGAVLILLSGVGFGIGYILLVLVLDMVMLLVCMKGILRREEAFQRIAIGVIYLHGMAFAYGKLVECAERLGAGGAAQIVVAAGITGIVCFLLVYRARAKRRCIYKVTLTENGEKVELKALFDTGNLLTDPISGKPVSVMEDTEIIRQWITKYPQKYKAIPYRSVGKEHGVLEGIVVDELIIQKEEEQVVKKETIVALYKGRLSGEGAFQMILNHNLI